MSTGSHFDSWLRIIRLQDRYLSTDNPPSLGEVGQTTGQRPLLLIVPDKWKYCDMGPTGFRPYILEGL